MTQAHSLIFFWSKSPRSRGPRHSGAIKHILKCVQATQPIHFLCSCFDLDLIYYHRYVTDQNILIEINAIHLLSCKVKFQLNVL